MKRIRADKYMFFLDLVDDVRKAFKENVTVTQFELERMDIDFEIRITRAGRLRMPATRAPLTKKQFEPHLVRANSRGLLPKKEQS